MEKFFLPKYLKGILFDLDGVLVDTMKHHDEAWRKAIGKYGLQISREEIYRREGEKGSVTASELLRLAGLSPSVDAVRQLIREKGEIFKASIKINLFPEALSCIEYCRKKYRLGLVTGSFLPEVKASLDVPFLESFEVIVTADDVHQGKPHPEPYLLALEKLKLKASEAIVIENAPYGIQAAKAASLVCIALTTSLSAQYLSEADLVLSNLDEVKELF